MHYDGNRKLANKRLFSAKALSELQKNRLTNPNQKKNVESGSNLAVSFT